MFERLKKDNQKKLDVFSKELAYIKNPLIKDVTEIAICYIHPLFFKEEASSSGKYHPAYAHGEGGLVRHTKAATYFAYQLSTIRLDLSDFEKDIAIASVIVHDSCKRGVHFEHENTQHEHPLLVKNLVPEGTFFDEELEIWNLMCEANCSHMGQWVTSNYSTITLPKPNSPLQMFVHECDYLASRKHIDLLIWDDNDSKIVEEEKRKIMEDEKAIEPMTEAQLSYIRKLVKEYSGTCEKLAIECKYSVDDNYSYLNKKTCSGFIAKMKKLINENQQKIATKPIF